MQHCLRVPSPQDVMIMSKGSPLLTIDIHEVEAWDTVDEQAPVDVEEFSGAF